MTSHDAQRTVRFFRALPADPKDAAKWNWDRRAIAKAVEALQGTDEFYLDEGDDRITFGESTTGTEPQQLKFYRVRRVDLPSLDNGRGAVSELDLEQDEGLAEAVHVMLFPNQVVGLEAFFFGPRVGRIESYVDHARRLASSDALNSQIVPILSKDAVDRMLDFKDMRLLSLRLRPSAMSLRDADELGLRGALKTAKDLDADRSIEIVLRAAPDGDNGFKSKVSEIVKKVLHNGSPAPGVDRIRVSGRSADSGLVEELDLLQEQLARPVQIPKEGRSRSVNSKAAFRAIQSAYDSVKSDLPNDGLATG
jgi:hypothetical protein